MSRSLSLALLAAVAAVAVAACAGAPLSGSSSRSPGAAADDRFNDVDRFPQPRGSSAYMRQ